jgi:hypothetical protein
LLACLCADKTVELFDVLTDDDAARKRKRKQQRLREKKRKAASGEAVGEAEAEAEAEAEEGESTVTADDMLRSRVVVRTAHKIGGMDLFVPKAKSGAKAKRDGALPIRLLLALNNNMLEEYEVLVKLPLVVCSLSSSATDCECLRHRSWATSTTD